MYIRIPVATETEVECAACCEPIEGPDCIVDTDLAEFIHTDCVALEEGETIVDVFSQGS